MWVGSPAPGLQPSQDSSSPEDNRVTTNPRRTRHERQRQQTGKARSFILSPLSIYLYLPIYLHLSLSTYLSIFLFVCLLKTPFHREAVKDPHDYTRFLLSLFLFTHLSLSICIHLSLSICRSFYLSFSQKHHFTGSLSEIHVLILVTYQLILLHLLPMNLSKVLSKISCVFAFIYDHEVFAANPLVS